MRRGGRRARRWPPPAHSIRLVECIERPGKILERRGADREVESVRRRSQVGGVAFPERDVEPCLLRIFVGDAYQCFADVDPNHFPPLFLVETEYRWALMEAEQAFVAPMKSD
jgi:hypothetical protein